MPRITALAVVLALMSGGCSRPPASASPDALAETRRAITETIDRYMVAARAVDASAVAAFYATTGVLFELGIQPIFGDTALYWGTYFEKLAFPGQPVSEQRGKFVIEWVRDRSSPSWLIQRYYRIPLPG